MTNLLLIDPLVTAQLIIIQLDLTQLTHARPSGGQRVRPAALHAECS